MSDAASPAEASARHLLPLDGLRGLAVLIVVFHNAAWVGGESQQFLLKLTVAITASGWIGVEIFFALSGFLITGILLDAKGKDRFFSSFYARRTLRIFPLYFTFIGVAFIVGPLVSTSTAWVAAVRAHQWQYWIYVSNWLEPYRLSIHGFSHLWSLAVEEQFYLLWPLVVRFSTRRTLLRLCVAILVVTPFIRYVLPLLGFPDDAAYHFTISRWDALAAGALIAVLWREEYGRRLLAVCAGPVAFVATVALLGLVLVQRGFHAFDAPVQVLGQSLIAILSACTLWGAVAEDGPRARRRLQALLSLPGLRVLGKYSYAMYVFHFPIHHALLPHLGPLVAADDSPWRFVRLVLYLLLILTLTFVAALISWRVIERPFLALKDRVAPRPS